MELTLPDKRGSGNQICWNNARFFEYTGKCIFKNSKGGYPPGYLPRKNQAFSDLGKSLPGSRGFCACCGRPWSPNAARTLYTSKGLRLATKLNPSLLANRTPSASNKPLPTDGLFPAHTLDLSLSAVQRCRPGWAGPRRHSPPRARSPSRPSNSSPARLSGAPVTSFFDR